uniref:peroxidasin-like isoform X2 n=1 Tax=Ciona intestinalis TaxID=7719 RepID=UPI00089DB2C4|nr:peroxidasin-like isoform X2 [Ciona intestinalis]|eukprot:XP_018667950.1 peroxidasin-like isoform X2 [Ciona intestinalis]
MWIKRTLTLCVAFAILVNLDGTCKAQSPEHRACPSGCLCFVTTVRCMHRRRDTIPQVAPETRVLDMRFNRIRSIPASTFRRMRNLNSLLLNNNEIQSISENAFRGLSSLKYLYLYKNKIRTIHKRAFNGLVSLEQLYLHDNKIVTVPSGTFATLPKLERLLLHSNLIETLPNRLFDDLTLKRLRLDGNRLRCDCDLAWLATYLQGPGRSVLATAVCYQPRSLSGRHIPTIQPSEFQCSDTNNIAPIFYEMPEDVEVQQGESVIFRCGVRGSPRPLITWHHDGTPVRLDTRVRKSTDGSLVIQTSRQSDRGIYKCTADNTVGHRSSSVARLTYRGAQGPPVFTTVPSNKEVILNGRVTFQCRSTGTPEPVTRWYHNHERLPVTPNFIVMPGTLHIRSASIENNGTYTCMAANSEGFINSSATLIVRNPPKFTVKPQDQTAIQGRSVTLDCHAEGIPEPTLSWLRNGHTLNRDQRYLVMTSGSLLIRGVNPGDEGTYTCKAESNAGVSTSDAFVTIMVPPRFTVRPQNQRVRQGLTVDFQCQVAGRPQPQIVWTINGRAVPDDPRYSLLPSGTLRLLRAQPEHAGNYRCEAANAVGAQHAQVSLTVIPPTPLSFVRTPEDQTVDAGTDVTIRCHVTGGGVDDETAPNIYWTKDNVRLTTSGRFSISRSSLSELLIRQVARDDTGRYECVARSGSDFISASMTLVVNLRNTVKDIVVKLAQILPADCLLHGCPDELDQSSHSSHDEEQSPLSLDELLNQHFLASASRQKRQSVVHLSELYDTIQSATNEVNRGINNSIQHFNNGRNRQSPGDLLALVRFPSTRAGVDLARAAEVFDVALRMIECCVRRGMRPRDFDVRHTKDRQEGDGPASLDGDEEMDVMSLIGSEAVELVANLSGCSAHRPNIDCSRDICFHRKYRSPDGTCNNLHHPMWGASLTPFHRLLQPIYENGFNAPISWNNNKKYNNNTLPSPRSVSVGVLMSAGSRPPRKDPDFTHMVMQWGQFLDHDLDFTTMAPSVQRFSDGLACKDTCEHEAPCFPILVDNDSRHSRFHHHPPSPRRHGRQHPHGSGRCMTFTRSSAVCGSGITSVFFSAISRREQINQITSYLDASNVYSSNDKEMRNLRDFSSDLGLLKEGQSLELGQKPLLPYNVYSDLESGSNSIQLVAPLDCFRGEGETARQRSVPCFLAGDLRANEQVSLTTMHTLWMREHNRIARYIKQVNQHWDGDTIFHETRKIIGAQMQHITYTHWLPKLLGPFTSLIGEYRGYDPNLPSSIVNVFATAAYRFGHTMINPIMYRLNETWHESRYGNLNLHEAFFAPFRIVHEGGIDPLIRGLIAKPMKARDSDSNMNEELIERLFSMAEEVALDLGALNIQRGRDHALPFYNEWRQFCNLSSATTFDDLATEIKNPEVRNKLRELYKVPANIDPFVGMIVEDVVPGSRLGPTLACLLTEQFKRTRAGDRFWYENPGIFSPTQVNALKQASLARVICDNTDSIKTVPRDVFLNQPQADFVSCDEIPSIDLSAWIDCCSDCSDSGSFETLSDHFQRRSRSKRSTNKRHSHRNINNSSNTNQPWDNPLTPSPPLQNEPRLRVGVKKMNKIEPEGIPSASMDKVLSVIEALESKISQLQGQVQTLEQKLQDRD